MFNPEQHLSDIKGKEYLEVKWRLVWFRDEHPTGSIDTQLVSIQGDTIIVRAAVIDSNGVLLGSGHGMADASIAKMAQGRIIEKAETAAIGRALAHAGYGTQFTGEEEGDFLADSPVERAQYHQPIDREIQQAPPRNEFTDPVQAIPARHPWPAETLIRVIGKKIKSKSSTMAGPSSLPQQQKLAIALGEACASDKERYTLMSVLTGKEIESSKQLTKAEASVLIDWTENVELGALQSEVASIIRVDAINRGQTEMFDGISEVMHPDELPLTRRELGMGAYETGA